MKQVVQYVSGGRTVLEDVPNPAVGNGQLLVSVAASLISAGTEKYVVDLARKNIFQKALARPDDVRRVLQKVRQEGLAQTVSQVNGAYHVPELGLCTPESAPVGRPQLMCRSSRPPTREVVITESGFIYSRPGDWMSNISLTPSPVWSTAAGLPNDWTGGAVTFRMRTPIARIRLAGSRPVG